MYGYHREKLHVDCFWDLNGYSTVSKLFTCTGCKTVLVLPIPSTVVTAIPSTAHNGIKQPFAEKCLVNVKVRGHKVNST